MTLNRKTFARNATVMMVSQITTWGFAFLLNLFLPRYLGPTSTGELSLVNAVWTIAAVFLGFGTDVYLIKTIASSPDRVPRLLPATLAIKAALFVVSSIVVWAYIRVMNYSETAVFIAFFIGLSVLGGIVVSTATAILTGIERMEFVSLANVITKVVYTSLCLLFLFLGLNVYWIAAASAVSVLFGIIVLWRAMMRVTFISFRFDMNDLREIATRSYPYLITSLMLVVYQSIDSIFIASLVDAKAVGYYSTAMALYGTMMFLPSVISTVLFPTLSRGFANAETQMESIVHRAFNLIFVISIPIGFGIAVVGEPFVRFIYGREFDNAGVIFSLFGVALIVTYANTLLSQILISMGRTSLLNWILFASILATFPLDLVLVPFFDRTLDNGALGGAFSFLFTEFGQLAVSILLLPKRTLAWHNVRSVVLTLFAGMVMSLSIYWLREEFIAIPVLVGGACYVVMILVLRVLPQSDLMLVGQLIARIRTRIRSVSGNASASSH